jgi:hypothetical protein
MRVAFAALLADRFASALGHVLDMTSNLLFRAPEFPEALLDLLDAGRGFFCFECVVVLIHGATRSEVSLITP